MHIKVLWLTWAIWKASVGYAFQGSAFERRMSSPIYLVKFVCLPGLYALLCVVSYGLVASKTKLEAG